MPTRFLFRLDMAKDNESFAARRRSGGVEYLYSGIPMKVGPGWIPDYVEVSVDRDSASCSLTLIELEAIESSARASCRKYLPESSSDIVRAFLRYLDAAISQSRSTADPRQNALEGVKRAIAGTSNVVVHTAGALRLAGDLVEDFPLSDQAERRALPVIGGAPSSSPFSFRGERRLTRFDSDGIRRAVRVIYAVIVGRDHSGGTLKSWRNIHQKPLDLAVEQDPGRYPHLRKLLSAETAHGLRVNCEELASEFATVCSATDTGFMSTERAVAIIEAFVPIVVTYEFHEPMQNVFDRARETLRATAI